MSVTASAERSTHCKKPPEGQRKGAKERERKGAELRWDFGTQLGADRSEVGTWGHKPKTSTISGGLETKK